MKFHLPKKLLVAVLAAVAATQVYAQTEQVTFDNSKEGVANVTVNGGDLSGYYMYGTYQNKPCAVGTIGAASVWDQDGNAPMEKFSSAIVTMNGGTGLQYLSGYGVGGNAFEGDVTVNMNGGDTEYIVGGTYYASSVNRDRDVLGTNPGYNHESFGYKANYGQESDPDSQRQNININVTGGEVGQIRGGHSGHSNSGIYKTYLPAVIKAGQDAIDAFWNSNPAAVSGDVNIAVTGGAVGGLEGETAAIQGAGGTGFSVDGTVRITVDGEAEVTGDIIAGSSNVYTFTGATEVAIKGGSVAGNVYAGGDGSGSPKIADGPAPTVKGATKVELSGGTVNGSVYGAGMNDVVNEGTAITISNDGTEVTGTIYGGGIDSEVSGDRTLTVDSSYTGDKEYKVADFTDIAVNADVTLSQMNAASEGTDVAIAEGAELTLTKGETASSATSITGSGTMKLDGAELAMTDAAGSVTTGIEMTEGAILDLNKAAATGDIQATSATIKNAGNVTGTVTASESLALEGAANLSTLDMTSGATLTGGDMSINTLNLGGNNTIISTGTVTIENGSIQLNDKNSISAGSLALGAGTTLTLEVSDSTTAPITLTSGTLSMAESSYVEVIFTDSYLDGVNDSGQKETALNILIASGAGADSSMQSSISYSGIDTLLWNVSDLQWTTLEGDMYVTGSLTRVTEIVIPEEGGDVPQDIVDTPSGDKVSLVISGQSTTITGNNSYSGSTSIENAEITLGTATALGSSTIKASGTNTISTAEGVMANLANTIENSGLLTLNGNYDASQMELMVYEETRVDTTGEAGSNGFFRAAGSTVHVITNTDETARVLLGEDFSISHSDIEHQLDTQTGIATNGMEIDYSTYTVADADHKVAVSEIQAVSADQTTKVEMSDGALTADADMEVATTGGELTVAGATVSGSIVGTTVISEGGQIAAAVSGESYIAVNAETTISGENTSTAGMQVNNTALTLGSATALGAGTVNAVDTSTITTAEGVTADLSSAILNSGTLTLDGSYDASALEVTAIDATRVDITGNEGDNGFQRDAGSSVVVVENCGEEASITLGENLSVSIGTKEYELDAVTGIATADAGTDYSTYYIAKAEHSVAVSEIQAVSADQTTKVEMSVGALTADADMEVATTGGELTVQNAKVSGSIADTAITSEGGEISADISGKSSVAVTGKTTLSGNNSYTGNTTIDGAELIVTRENALGTGEVIMKNHAILDLQGMNISNRITVYGCTLAGASSYTGNLVVDSGELTLRDATKADTVEVSNGATLTGADLTANTVTVTDNGAINDVAVTAGSVTVSSGGSISGATLTAKQVTVNSEANKESKITSAVTITDNGTLTVNGDQNLDVTGSLTLGSGSTVKLNGEGKVNVAGKVTIKKGASIITSGEFEVGDELISSETPIEVEEGVKFTFGTLEVELQKGETSLVIVSMFKQELADAYTLSNWGMVTASRAVVNAVRGQRSNTGCIANGRGTAWAAVLGGNHDINGGDINLKGAAVGADMKVGSRSKLGLALGYTEADIKPDGIAASDSTGTYIAAYGEYLIKKLSPTSCLSLDWVASYGQTESERNSLDWEQQSLQFNTRLSWNKQVKERLCISVFGGLEYYTNESDTVEGVKTGSIQNLRGEIGVGARYVAWGTPAVADGKGGSSRPGCEKLVFTGELRYMNDMVRSNPVVRMNGLSGMGENPGRQGVGIEAGATYRIGERWSASANYGFNTMEDSKEHRVNVGASYTF